MVVLECRRGREGRVERSEEGDGVGADFVVFWIRERPDAVRLCEPVEEDEDDGEERVEEDVEANGKCRKKKRASSRMRTRTRKERPMRPMHRLFVRG